MAISVDSKATAAPSRIVPDRWHLADWNQAQPELVPVIDPPSPRDWENCRRARLPLVLRGYSTAWRATRRWTFDEMANRVGPRLVPLVRVHDGMLGYREGSGMDYHDRPFDEFARAIGRGDNPGWFLQLNPDSNLPELVDDLELPTYSSGARWRDRKLTIAAAGTTTPLHRELPDNLFTVIRGKKEIALFSPKDSRHLYGYGVFSGVPHFSAVDPRRFDPERHPLLERSTPLRCQLGAGDALFIPRGWWHAVQTIEPSIALGSWWATGAWSLLPRAAGLYKRLFKVRT